MIALLVRRSTSEARVPRKRTAAAAWELRTRATGRRKVWREPTEPVRVLPSDELRGCRRRADHRATRRRADRGRDHGLLGVLDQVKEHLLELSHVRPDLGVLFHLGPRQDAPYFQARLVHRKDVIDLAAHLAAARVEWEVLREQHEVADDVCGAL